MNMTPYMTRLTRARPDKLRCTLFVAPGRARDLVARLRSRDIWAWAHSDTTVRVEESMSILQLYERIQVLVGAVGLLRTYVELRSLLRQGQRRAPDLTERLVATVDRVLALQGD